MPGASDSFIAIEVFAVLFIMRILMRIANGKWNLLTMH
jgi:hypothetical protein